MKFHHALALFMVNKNSPIPLYYQLMQIIKNSIESGELRPGDPVASETDLMKKYDISRATVRQAILQLVNEGFLRRVKTRGTFVNSPRQNARFLGNLKGFYEEMKHKGIGCSTRVLDKCIIPAPVRVAEKLQLASNETVFYIKRLRCVQEEPVLIVENYLPHALCHEIENEDFENVSLYELMEKKYGLLPHHGHREFEPVILSSGDDSRLLQISPKMPILYVESTVYTENNIPIEYYESRMRGKFAVDLVHTET